MQTEDSEWSPAAGPGQHARKPVRLSDLELSDEEAGSDGSSGVSSSGGVDLNIPAAPGVLSVCLCLVCECVSVCQEVLKDEVNAA